MATPIPVIRFSNNPADFTRVDGIVVNELRPPGGILGLPGNDIICVGDFERGATNTVLQFGSSRRLEQVMGDVGPDANGAFYGGALALRAKRWGRLHVMRVATAGQVAATVALDDATVPTNVLDITADSVGAWGNSLTASIEAATDGVAGHFNLVIKRDSKKVEEHQNLDLTVVADGVDLPITSNFVKATRIVIGDGRPVNVADAALATGSDGTVADADFVTAINLLTGDSASNIRWVFAAEKGNSTVNDALELLAAGGLKNVILNGESADDAATVKTGVASYRSDRIGYAYPWVKIFVPEAKAGQGDLVTVAPASFVANVLAHMEPGQNPAGPNGVAFMKGIRALVNPNLTNTDFEDFRRLGIMGLQFTKESQQFEIRSGITTSLDSALKNWARRTMADFIDTSVAQFLVAFRNKRINLENKLQILVAVTDFLARLQRQGLLPTKKELNEFRPSDAEELEVFLVDITSGNTPEDEAEGIFEVQIRVRTHATMDFIVLTTEIGERVEINPAGA